MTADINAHTNGFKNSNKIELSENTQDLSEDQMLMDAVEGKLIDISRVKKQTSASPKLNSLTGIKYDPCTQTKMSGSS